MKGISELWGVLNLFTFDLHGRHEVLVTTTLWNSPNVVGHNNFVGLPLVYVMPTDVGHINFQSTLVFL